jgi:hypothetical protein
MAAESVSELAELYLGNLLYALERCAIALEAVGKAADAAFYRALARKLAKARGEGPGRAVGPATSPSPGE